MENNQVDINEIFAIIGQKEFAISRLNQKIEQQNQTILKLQEQTPYKNTELEK